MVKVVQDGEIKTEEGDVKDGLQIKVGEESQEKGAGEKKPEEDKEPGSKEILVDGEEKDEPWMKVEDPEGKETKIDPASQVPTRKHVALKHKLRGQIAEKDTEIETLKADIVQLKASASSASPLETEDSSARPRALDYDSDEEYDFALDAYYDKKFDAKLQHHALSTTQTQTQKAAQQKLSSDVDQHYERASKLLETSGIKPEIFKDADGAVRNAVNIVMPNQGDMVVDAMISSLGKGSEKVMYYLGRNAGALAKFQGLLSSDPSGIKASIYLGEERARLTNLKTNNNRSKAPDPAPHVKGDAATSANERALKKTYDEAHKGGNLQNAYNAKKEARSAGINVSSW